MFLTTSIMTRMHGWQDYKGTTPQRTTLTPLLTFDIHALCCFTVCSMQKGIRTVAWGDFFSYRFHLPSNGLRQYMVLSTPGSTPDARSKSSSVQSQADNSFAVGLVYSGRWDWLLYLLTALFTNYSVSLITVDYSINKWGRDAERDSALDWLSLRYAAIITLPVSNPGLCP